MDMLYPKLVSTGVFYSSGFVFAMGGNNDGACERYDVANDEWKRIPSFAGKIESENSLYTYVSVMTK